MASRAGAHVTGHIPARPIPIPGRLDDDERVDVRFVAASAIEQYQVADLKALLERDDGLTWVDVPECDDEASGVLSDVFAVHPMALHACQERNHTPSVHGYPGHVFVVLHSPEVRQAGHVHLLELDQFIGRNYLVTVHGPVNPVVPLEAALEETRGVLRRLESGRFRPRSPAELSYAIVSAMVRRQRTLIGAVAERAAGIETRVMTDELRNPEPLLEQMFLLRHELLTVRTMAAEGREVYARMLRLPGAPAQDRPWVEDLLDQFDRVRSIGDGEKEFLAEVMDLYQTRVTTKMTMAMERLAVLAAVTLPITAIASVYGMNVIVNQRTHVAQLGLVLALMLVISGLLLRWTKRQGWW
jgi:Mg2+ and Co2+ transporter CorA